MSEQKELIAILKEQTELLKEILKWVKFSGSNQVTSILNSALDNDKKKLAYHLSDGKNTSTVIAKKTGISQPKISEYWREWLVMGLGEALTASGGSRFRRSFDLRMFGITVPEINQGKQQEGESIETQVQTGGDKSGQQ